MDLHANAVLTVRQRRRLCDLVRAGVTITAAASSSAAPGRPRRSGSTAGVEASRLRTARAGRTVAAGGRRRRSSRRSCAPARSFARDRT